MDREGEVVSDRTDVAPAAHTRSGVDGLRYTKLGYVAINVTDIARSRHFYETVLGLEVSGAGPGGEIFLRCSNDHHNIILYPASKASLRRLGWQMESEEALDRLFEHATRSGLAPRAVAQAELDALEQGRSYRIIEPTTGATLEFYARQRDDFTFTPSVAKVQRLGHVVMTTADYEATTRFFLETLNFRTSDSIGDRVMFMRCFPNPFHHSFGLANGRANGLHHINFMVSEIDDIGKAIWRFQKEGVEIVYGPGRHPPSNSVFLYANDPDGITCEYSYGMEEFPEVGAREPRMLPEVQESSDTWGAAPPRIKPALIEMAEEMDFGAVPIAVA
jgi:2,3-dihydroxy-p-cumate/2,3-dihydroxybenzoate 3,4-dioxygenase